MLFANFGPTCVKKKKLKELAISDFSVMFVIIAMKRIE